MSTLPPESDKPIDGSSDALASTEPVSNEPELPETVPTESTNAEPPSQLSAEAEIAPETKAVESNPSIPHLSLSKLQRRQLGIGAAVLVIGGVAAILPFFKATSPDTEAGPPPTDSERFADLYKALTQSSETAFRCDALLINDEMLRSLTTVERLTSLHVKVEGLSTQTAAQLGAMPHLEELHLRGSQVDDPMLRALAQSQSLRVLNLPSCVVSPEAIEALRAMPNLRNLRLGIKQGSNQHARAVASISRLRAVHLIGVAVTDEGLQSLAEMRSLESLYLDDSAVTEAGWLWLFENYPELHVHIDQSHHDRDPQNHKH